MNRHRFTHASILAAAVCFAAGCQDAHQHELTLLSPDQGDRLWFSQDAADHLGSGNELQIYVDTETHPHASASFAKFSLGAGKALPIHRHDKTEEIAYILSGRGVVLKVEDDGKVTELSIEPGYVWYNPPSIWHGVRNDGIEPLVMVFATIPNERDGLMSFFRKIGVTPGEDPKPISPEDFARLGTEHDLILREGSQSE